MTRILTITLNPAIDQTVTLERLVPGTVHRASAVRRNPGGKGVNVASCLADAGIPVAAAGFLGRQNAGSFETLFAEKGIGDHFIRVPGATRINLKLLDKARTTDINMPGFVVTPDVVESLIAEVEALAGPDRPVIVAGSVPAGCPIDLPATLVARLAARGAPTLLDTSGPALRAALAAPVLPYCVKPNRDELSEWAERPLDTLEAIAIEARRLLQVGVSLVIVSMGSDGALFATEQAMLAASLPAVASVSTVGAGDAMVAGAASALIGDADIETIARTATAFAVAKLGCEGPNLPRPAEIDRLAGTVRIDSVTGARP